MQRMVYLRHDDARLRLEHSPQLLVHGSEGLAVAAPRREELYKGVLGGVHHQGIERIHRQVYDG